MGLGLDSPRGTLTGLEWRGLAPLAPLTVLPGPPRLAPVVLGRQGLAQSRSLGTSGQASSVAQPEVAFLWSLSPVLGWKRGAAVMAAAPTANATLLAEPQCPWKVRMEAASDTGTLPK